ncbi:MAG TPA: glycogen debranching enzyme N-terminal domain-containing protein, partial [Gemmatimonadaceae bacterium]|nr:glycogen debranching enzyme N-terminal domain-containing protein [Gemmatimonadaceae bacterium]
MTRRLIDRVVRTLPLPEQPDARLSTLLETEWLVTNGIGGYSSCTAAGVTTRRYHGLLVAALPNPLGRMVMLNHLGERLRADEGTSHLNVEERVGGPVDPVAASKVSKFRLESGLPVWEYSSEGVCIEKRIMMPRGQNTVHVTYRLLEGPETATLELRPAVHFRGYESRVDATTNSPATTRYTMMSAGDMHVLQGGNEQDLPPLKFLVAGADTHRFISDAKLTSEYIYPVEQSRGYEFRGTLWTPGHFEVTLRLGASTTLIASVELDEVMRALSPGEAAVLEHERRRRLVDAAAPALQDEIGAELVLAADQFIITPKGRLADATRAAALGNEVRTVIAGYHWFTDWGRDTMISLEGLTLAT